MSTQSAGKGFSFTRRELLEEIADITGGRCLLAFSRGKDAIAAWLELRASGLFHTIVPFHLDNPPGLQFIEESLQYYEQWFGTHIIRLTHISFYRMIGCCIDQPPERVEIIRRLGLTQCTNFTYNDLRIWLAQDLGWPEKTTWVANGVRAADSPQRRIHIVKSRGKNFTSQQFYPVFDYRIADVRAAIERAGIKLPVDYEMFKRTFDGTDYRFIKPLRDRFPADYERLLFWYPMAEMDILRHEEMD